MESEKREGTEKFESGIAALTAEHFANLNTGVQISTAGSTGSTGSHIQSTVLPPVPKSSPIPNISGSTWVDIVISVTIMHVVLAFVGVIVASVDFDANIQQVNFFTLWPIPQHFKVFMVSFPFN